VADKSEVQVWNTKTWELRFRIPTVGTPACFVQHSRLLILVQPNGVLSVVSIARRENIATLVPVRSSADWLVVTPNGLFDGSQAGEEAVAWRVGAQTYPASKFFADFYTPDLFARLLQGEDLKAGVDISKIKLPPEVHIHSDVTGETDQQDLQLELMARSQGGGIGQLKLYHNGKLVADIPVKPGSMNASSAVNLQLVPGENLLRAVADNERNSRNVAAADSNDDILRITYRSPEQGRPALWVVVVGIDHYKVPSWNLGYAVKDANSIADFFEGPGKSIFREVHTERLPEALANRNNVEQALEKLKAHASPNDVVLIYFAGHGYGVGEQFYFLTPDMGQDLTETSLSSYAISASWLAQKLHDVPALKQVFILDTCQSETALPVIAKAMFRGGDMLPSEKKAVLALARSRGFYLIAATTREGLAAEIPEIGHGILTYALLSAFGEVSASHLPSTGPDKIVTMHSLLQYLDEQVPAISEQYRGEYQFPVSSSTGMDFPIAISQKP
jgi:hypothetical protein